jgi:hypothetical protein
MSLQQERPYLDCMYVCLHGTVEDYKKEQGTLGSIKSLASKAFFTKNVYMYVCKYVYFHGIVKDLLLYSLNWKTSFLYCISLKLQMWWIFTGFQRPIACLASHAQQEVGWTGGQGTSCGAERFCQPVTALNGYSRNAPPLSGEGAGWWYARNISYALGSREAAGGPAI